MSLTLEEVSLDYMKKYNKNSLNENDEKLVNAIFNLRSNYKEALEKRKCTIFLKENPKNELIISETEIKTEVKTPKTNEKTQNDSKTQCTCQCKAITMKGTQCSSKAKPNSDFCGRHLK